MNRNSESPAGPKGNTLAAAVNRQPAPVVRTDSWHAHLPGYFEQDLGGLLEKLYQVSGVYLAAAARDPPPKAPRVSSTRIFY